MESGFCKPFGMEIEVIEDMPEYCAQLVKLLANEPQDRGLDIRGLPTPTRYDGAICTLLTRWALQDNQNNLKVGYNSQANSYYANFLFLRENFDPCLLGGLENAYQQRIEELQRGWWRLKARACRLGKFAIVMKESDVEEEPRVISLLASAFGFVRSNFGCAHSRRSKKICLAVKADRWDRFQEVFGLQIDERQ